LNSGSAKKENSTAVRYVRRDFSFGACARGVRVAGALDFFAKAMRVMNEVTARTMRVVVDTPAGRIFACFAQSRDRTNAARVGSRRFGIEDV